MYMDHDRSTSGCSSKTKSKHRKVEIVAPNVPGAGWDLTARAMQKR